MAKRVITPNDVHRPFGYAHAIQKGDTIYVSGQIPMDMNMKIVGVGDIAAQTEQVYENLRRVLAAAGAAMTDIVMMNIYTRDLEAFDQHTRHVRKKYFGSYYPAVTAVQVSRLYQPESLIEIEAVAVVE